MIRLPPPPPRYDPLHQTKMQAEVERALRSAAQINSQVSFGRVDTVQLYIDGVPYTPGGTGTVTSVSGAGGTTGLTLTGGPITTVGTLTLGGTLAIAHGGTGATSAAAARAALGAGTGNGTVTSVAASGGTTGLSFTGGPIVTSGTLTLTGTLAIANGGTGATNAAAARANLGAGTGDGTVTSVAASGGLTGLSFIGSPIVTSGTLTLTGTLAVAFGGTGVTTVEAGRVQYGAQRYVNTSIPGGNTVSNTTTETAFASTYTIPAGNATVGKRYRIRARGTLATAAGSPTWVFRLYIGGTSVLATPSVAINSAGSRAWFFEADVIVLTVGALGTADPEGSAVLPRTTVAAPSDVYGLTNAGAFSWNTTIANVISITVQCGTANVNNVAVLRQLIVEEYPL